MPARSLVAQDGVIPILSHIPPHAIPLPLCWLRRPDLGADLMCLSALALAMAGMVTRKARSAITYAIMWYSYLCMQALIGHDPPLLFEAGFLAIILGPGRPPTAATDPVVAALSDSTARVGLVSARWVLFRLLFGAGVVKLLGGDPSWWGLTATSHHYQSQPLPTPLAWWMHKLPMPMHKLSTVIMFVIECGVSMLCFAPDRGTLRRAAFAAQLGLQIIMGATGSFSFFQVLTAILAIPLLASAPCGDTAVVSAATVPTAVAPSSSVWTTVFHRAASFVLTTASAVSTRWAFVEKLVGVATVTGGILAFRVPLFRPIFSLVRGQAHFPVCQFTLTIFPALALSKSDERVVADDDQAHVEFYTRFMTGAAVVLAGRELVTECGSCLAAVVNAFSRSRTGIAGAQRTRGLAPGTFGLMVHAIVSSAGGLVFFLASLHPFTRGVSTTFVRSFLGPRQLQPQVCAAVFVFQAFASVAQLVSSIWR